MAHAGINGAPVQIAAAYYDNCLGLRPIPMWGVDAGGNCRCGGVLPGGRPCNAGKHALDDREPWKDGRAYAATECDETQCRRLSPTGNRRTGSIVTATWPLVAGGDWCGQWSARTSEQDL